MAGVESREASARAVGEAMRDRDFAAMAELLADDVVVRSPITSSFCFEGKREVLELLEMVRGAYDELRYTDLIGAGDMWAQVFEVRIGRAEMEGLDTMRFDASGRVSEFTVFFRPLPGLAALTAALAPPLARRRARWRAIAARILTAPLVLLTRFGDAVAVRLVRPKG